MPFRKHKEENAYRHQRIKLRELMKDKGFGGELPTGNLVRIRPGKNEATQHEEETHSRLAAKIKLLPYQMERHNQRDGETSNNLDTFKFLLVRKP